KIIIILSVILMPSMGLSQKTKRVQVENEQFYVLKDDRKIKHGEYLKSLLNIEIKGQYDMNEKVGLWEYKMHGSVIQKYNFSTNTLEYDDGSTPFPSCTLLATQKLQKPEHPD